MNPYRDIAGQALAALRDNRLRTALSVLGITIGIAAVMTVGAVSGGGRHLIFAELQTFGLRTVWVDRDTGDKDPRRAVRAGSGIDNQDFLAIAEGCCEAVRRATPLVFTPGPPPVVRRGSRYTRADVEGVGADYIPINNDSILEGRPLRAADVQGRRRVAVIGPVVRRDLFGTRAEVIGGDIRIGEDQFTVVGVLQTKNRGFLSSIGSAGDTDVNARILLPYTTYQQILGHKEIGAIQAEALSLERAPAAGTQLTSALTRRHAGQYQYRAQTMAQYIDTVNRILRGVWLMGVIAASVSLLVGGTAIMNIMSTAVVERTREIGVRRAIGATRRDILMQFLMEAALISAAGGMLGIALGFAVSVMVSVAAGFPLALSPVTMLVALAVSVAVGLASGFYPARRAAALKPILALRYE